MRHTTIPRSALAVGALVLAAGLATAPPAAALHSVFVAVPGHAEEALTWCGPAVGQMIMEGYPSGACTVVQADVWASIGSHRVEGMWDTDPRGLRGAMMDLCPPPGGGWSAVSRSAADDLMYQVAFWMTHNDYPVALLTSTVAHNAHAPHQETWVVVKGVVTDVDPTTSSTVALQYVQLTDPSPATFGDPPVERFLTGGAFYAALQPVAKPGSEFDGRYVAVIEPPQRRGVARAELPLLAGRVLPWERVQELSKRWLEKVELLRELKPFAALYRAEPQRPLLVDAEHGGYYIVPFADEREREKGTYSHALLLNAYDGSFLEAGAFAPARTVGEKEAVERALKLLGVRRPERLSAALTFAPQAGAADRYHPAWRVEVDGRAVAVSQDGDARFWPRPRKEPRRPGEAPR